METVDVDYEDLKSPGSNTVWVRPPPALPNILGIPSIEPQYMGHRSLLTSRLLDSRAIDVQLNEIYFQFVDWEKSLSRLVLLSL